MHRRVATSALLRLQRSTQATITFPIALLKLIVIWCPISNNDSIQLIARETDARWKKIRASTGKIPSPRRAQVEWLPDRQRHRWCGEPLVRDQLAQRADRENPGYDKLRAIAKAMGLPAQLCGSRRTSVMTKECG
jgi:hypothetical protein